jgi:hypothetical protein
MNGAHLHLVVNHVSLFAMVIGAALLAASMKKQSVDLRAAATVIFIVGGVFALIAFESGEKAEDVLKAMGPSVWAEFKPFVHQHEEAAEWALRSSILVGTLALGMEWAARFRKAWLRKAQWVLVLFALHGCTVYAATAFLGGKVRHTEVRGESEAIATHHDHD